MTKRIAMWSGPRNISTAMMRSWENRQDCSVIDEPFYAFYLTQTQSPHPMFDEILQSQDSDYAAVAKQMSEGPCDTPLQYQKHMTHHMLTGCDMSWTASLSHCFLIRDPAYVVNSYTKSRGECSAEDIGIKRQYELYQEISAITQQAIPVVDSLSVLQNPIQQMQKICHALTIDFDLLMLNWPAGKRESDGVWASHWYKSVEKSRGFAFAETFDIKLSKQQLEVVEEVTPFYQALRALAL